MSRLAIYHQDRPETPLFETQNPNAISERLREVGVRFERWQADAPLAPGAAPEQVLAAYRNDIDRLMRDGGYRAADVISMSPEHPDRVMLRKKFSNEHVHAEDEVRFFVAGSGLFTMHFGEQVFVLLCRQNDLINLPAGTKHWFDMSETPSFIAIRLFTNPAGWVAEFTGNPIAERFPEYKVAAEG